MQGKLIAVAYTLRTYWNQFSLGGICKQEKMQQCSFSIRGGEKYFILIIYIIVSYDQNISLIFYVKDESHVRLWHPSCLHYRPETVHCSTKDAYTSEITFLALKPWYIYYLWCYIFHRIISALQQWIPF